MEGEPTYVSKPLPTPAFPFSFQTPGDPYTLGQATNAHLEPMSGSGGGNGGDDGGGGGGKYVTGVTWNGSALVVSYSEGEDSTIPFSDCP